MDRDHLFEILIFLKRQSAHLLISQVSTVFFFLWEHFTALPNPKNNIGCDFIMIERDALIAEKYKCHCEMAQRFRIASQDVFCNYKERYKMKIGEDMQSGILL